MLENSKQNGLGQFGQLLLMVFLVLLIMGVTALTAYNPLWGNIPLNIILPLIVVFISKTIFFEKLKLFTLILMRLLLVFAVIGWIKGNFYVNLVIVFLIINILEATITSLKNKSYFNFVSGLFLAASVLTLKGLWRGYIYEINNVNVWGTICWIAAYTIWSWIFVSHEFDAAIAKYHIGLIAVPTILSIITLNAGLWVLFRAFSLTFGGGVIQLGFKKQLKKNLSCPYFKKFVDKTKEKKMQIFFMILNIALISVPIILAVQSKS